MGDTGDEDNHHYQLSSASPTRSSDVDRSRRVPCSVPSPIRRPRGAIGAFSNEDDTSAEGGGEVSQSIRAWPGTSHLLFHYPMEREDLAVRRASAIGADQDVIRKRITMHAVSTGERVDHRMASFLGGVTLNHPVVAQLLNGGEHFPFIGKLKQTDVVTSADELQHIPTQEAAASMLQRYVRLAVAISIFLLWHGAMSITSRSSTIQDLA